MQVSSEGQQHARAVGGGVTGMVLLSVVLDVSQVLWRACTVNMGSSDLLHLGVTLKWSHSRSEGGVSTEVTR